jgi:hypothetical protein
VWLEEKDLSCDVHFDGLPSLECEVQLRASIRAANAAYRIAHHHHQDCDSTQSCNEAMQAAERTFQSRRPALAPSPHLHA